MDIEGESIRVTGRPNVDRVTITISESCEITVASHDAIQFALLLLNVASTVYQDHLGLATVGPPAAGVSGERVM